MADRPTHLAGWTRHGPAAALALCISSGNVLADGTPAPGTPGQPATDAAAASTAAPAAPYPYAGDLLGGLFGLRPALARYGVTLNLNEVDEVFGNVSGGIRRSAAYDGLTTASVQIDTGAALGLDGGTLDASALQYHGRNFSQDTLLNLQTESGIETQRATRLWELWYDQKFGKAVDVKLGQQTLDAEFMVSPNALLFFNTVMGWPLVPSDDLPGGGPAYPLSSLGVRVQAKLSPSVIVLAGVFNGSPLSKSGTNRSGTSFPLDGKQFIIGEAQFTTSVAGGTVTPDHPGALAGMYRLGFWVDTQSFADQRYDINGVSLAYPASDGIAQAHRNNWSIYGVMDRAIWQPRHGGPRVLNMFLRAMGAPADRNLVRFAVNGGLVMHQPLPNRDADSAGIGFGYGQISSFVRGLDRDEQAVSGAGFARSNETYIEATYQYVPIAWCQIQPDFQFTFNPGAGIANPLDPIHKIRNEAVLGLRTNVTF